MEQISSLLGTCLRPSLRLGICQQPFLFLISEKKKNNIACSGFSNTAGGGWGIIMARVEATLRGRSREWLRVVVLGLLNHSLCYFQFHPTKGGGDYVLYGKVLWLPLTGAQRGSQCGGLNSLYAGFVGGPGAGTAWR